MSRLISCAMTIPQVDEQIKDVTRRTGWLHAKVGMVLWIVKKAMGLKKDEKIEYLAVVEVTNVRRERLDRMIKEPDYGREEVEREGFKGHPTKGTPEGFVAFFCEGHTIEDPKMVREVRNRKTGEIEQKPVVRQCRPDDIITRIEWKYLDYLLRDINGFVISEKLIPFTYVADRITMMAMPDFTCTCGRPEIIPVYIRKHPKEYITMTCPVANCGEMRSFQHGKSIVVRTSRMKRFKDLEAKYGVGPSFGNVGKSIEGT